MYKCFCQCAVFLLLLQLMSPLVIFYFPHVYDVVCKRFFLVLLDYRYQTFYELPKLGQDKNELVEHSTLDLSLLRDQFDVACSTVWFITRKLGCIRMQCRLFISIFLIRQARIFIQICSNFLTWLLFIRFFDRRFN